MRRRSTNARFQRLEDRRMLAPVDLSPTAFNVSGSNLSVTYNVAEVAAPAFDIGIYSSSDGVTPGTLLMSHRVTNSADRSVGTGHVVGFQANFSDLATDYSLLVKLDSANEAAEEIESNNTRLFAGGVFQAADGAVHVHGTSSADTVTITQGSQVSVTLNGNTTNVGASGVTALRMRTQGGADTASGNSNVTKPITAFGGSGDDQLTGGNAADTLFGGAGNDNLSGLDGNDSLYGEAGYDILYGGYGNDYLWGGNGTDSLSGGGQSDTVQDAPAIQNFTGSKGDGNVWTFSGTVSDDSAASGSVTFGGLLNGSTAPIGPNGEFEIEVQFPPGTTGWVTVTWTDSEGLVSNLGSVYIS